MAIFLVKVYSQGLTCADSDPFCTGTIYEFPAGTIGEAESGPVFFQETIRIMQEFHTLHIPF
jgi:hypothetical protein